MDEGQRSAALTLTGTAEQKSRAKGRNGTFVPRRAEVKASADGQRVTVGVFSQRAKHVDKAPVLLDLVAQDAEAVATAMLEVAAEQLRTLPRAVVLLNVIESLTIAVEKVLSEYGGDGDQTALYETAFYWQMEDLRQVVSRVKSVWLGQAGEVEEQTEEVDRWQDRRK